MPERIGRGVSLQFVFATYMAQVAEVEVAKDGAVRVRRVVCAVDCGTVVNPDTVRAQIQSAVMFGITAALYGKITLKDGRVEQTNFDSYQILRMNEAPAVDVHIVQSSEPPGGMGEAGTSCTPNDSKPATVNVGPANAEATAGHSQRVSGCFIGLFRAGPYEVFMPF